MGPSIGLSIAVLGLAALVVAGGSPESSPEKKLRQKLLQGPVRMDLHGILGGGVEYPARVKPEDIVAIFTEWRADHGPVGSTRIHLRHPHLTDQINVKESVPQLLTMIPSPMVPVTWRPDWTPSLGKPSEDKKASHRPVWVSPAHVASIGRSNIYSQEKRQALGAVCLADGFMLDKLLETWPELQELFSKYDIPYKPWKRYG